ncbi:hypothetical protein AJ80_04088 [Polytolypa hystricis UAMH7299]|uniref:Cwf19-like C-terminal domain-containing protein n=1 Tax=Polytolypa hystricis (strain UAMH7299) TaxID=1447883 RepID=A0A2B7YDW0_POLH7|nr:hypothetical protein AJ80_04088 [Polytolypa hystricis UAMH7299]
MASKIVVIGSVNCSIKDVFTKLAKLHAKQNFAFAIILGDLFGDGSDEGELDEIMALLQGTISVPLPTYFTVGNNMIPERIVEKLQSDDEVCENLYYLGRRGTLKTSEGIRIVALGGNLATAASDKPSANDKYLPQYTESDARSLFGARTADILITNQWPKSIRLGSNVEVPEDTKAPEGVQCVADLCSTLKPRYHFASEASFFFEREPFFHTPTEEMPEVRPITRFINMAPFGNPTKQKWLYAFSLDVNAPAPTIIPTGVTASPLPTLSQKRHALPGQQESYSRFSRGDDYQRPSKRARRPPPDQSECFFCLSNPNITTHLITSIGSESYLTTAKGPLPTSTTFPSLGFPGHMLIIPFTHSPTFEAIPDSASRSSTQEEMHKYKGALQSMVHERSKGELGAVTWEVSRGNGIHIHWQFLPVSENMINRGLVEAAFKVEAENLKYPKFERISPEKEALERGDYFRVWIWGAPETSSDGKDEELEAEKARAGSSFIFPLTPNFRFDLQFGRRVMAKLLQLEDRINWKDTPQTEEEEKADVSAFKKAFEKFDFSLEEE